MWILVLETYPPNGAIEELLDLPARHAALDAEISCIDCRDNCSNNGIYMRPADLGTGEGCVSIMYHIKIVR